MSHDFRCRWNDHIHYMSEGFNELRFDKLHCDTTLVTDEGYMLNAHAAILSVSSRYFEQAFRNVTPGQHAIVVLCGANYQELSYILDYIYQGTTKVDQHLMKSVLELADMLEIKGLSKLKNNLTVKKLIAPSVSPQLAENSAPSSPAASTSHVFSPIHSEVADENFQQAKRCSTENVETTGIDLSLSRNLDVSSENNSYTELKKRSLFDGSSANKKKKLVKPKTEFILGMSQPEDDIYCTHDATPSHHYQYDSQNLDHHVLEQDSQRFDYDPCTLGQETRNFDRNPYNLEQETRNFDRNPYNLEQKTRNFNRVPHTLDQRSKTYKFDCEPYTLKKENCNSDRNLYAIEQENCNSDRNPYAKEQENCNSDRNFYTLKKENCNSDRNPYTLKKENCNSDRNPYAVEQENWTFDCDPYAMEQETDNFDRDAYDIDQETSQFDQGFCPIDQYPDHQYPDTLDENSQNLERNKFIYQLIPGYSSEQELENINMKLSKKRPAADMKAGYTKLEYKNKQGNLRVQEEDKRKMKRKKDDLNIQAGRKKHDLNLQEGRKKDGLCVQRGNKEENADNSFSNFVNINFYEVDDKLEKKEKDPLRITENCSKRSESRARTVLDVLETRIRKPKAQIKRPPGKYALYMKSVISAVRGENPGLSTALIMRLISLKWNRLPKEEKDEWERKEKELFHFYKKENPNYEEIERDNREQNKRFKTQKQLRKYLLLPGNSSRIESVIESFNSNA